MNSIEIISPIARPQIRVVIPTNEVRWPTTACPRQGSTTAKVPSKAENREVSCVAMPCCISPLRCTVVDYVCAAQNHRIEISDFSNWLICH
jgi:hypothetical protein